MTSRRWLLDVAIGPVAGFIAAGRRSRDLWWGSTWVSECTRQTARWLKEEQGVELIVPSWKRIEEVEDKIHKLDPLTYAGRVSNRIRALASASSQEEVERIARGAEAEARHVLSRLIRRSVRLDDLEADGLSNSDRATQERRAKRIRAWLREILDEKAFREQLEAIEDGADFLEFFAVWTPAETNAAFGAAYRRADELLSASKHLRPFGEPAWTAAGRRKSDLDAGRDSVLRSASDRGQRRSSAPATARRRLGIGPDEGLDALGLARRVAALTRGPMLQPLPFPPLARIAADSWLERAAVEPACRKAFARLNEILEKERERPGETLFFLWCSPARDPVESVADRTKGPGLFRFDASILLEGGLEAESAKVEALAQSGGAEDAELHHALEVLEALREPIGFLHRRLGTPPPYYALLQMDGDGVGSALGNAGQVADIKACVKGLERFADRAEEIVREHHGCAFYVGGDDLAVYLPVDKATLAARALARAFVAEVQPTFEDLRLGTSSLSGGIVLAHFKADLRSARREAREALEAAKGFRREAGSGSAWLEVRELPRSGSPRRCHGPLEDRVAGLETWVELLAAEKLSRRAPHQLLALKKRLVPAQAVDGGTLALELAAFRVAAQQRRSTKAVASDLPARLEEAQSWGAVERQAVELLIADRVHETRKLRPRAEGEAR